MGGTVCIYGHNFYPHCVVCKRHWS